MIGLRGKAAIITGASRGIGYAIAERFLSEGASVVACDSAEARLMEACQRLRTIGTVTAVAGDISDAKTCAAVVDTCLNEYGHVHIVINNAGIARFARFLDHSEDDWERTIAVDLKAVFLLSQRAANAMVASGGGGVILSTTSANGLVAEPGVAAYNAAKAGVVLLTKTMAIELASHRIRANCVAPGHIGPTALAREGGANDEFFEGLEHANVLGRLGRVEEVAALFAFLASDEAEFITGECIVIDGGQLAIQYGATTVS
jgi:3-oxoacyl-[acyl-carrier protein] reductase